ncbi:MAG: hypothetical protein ACTSYA_13330 [Candidatus Kariarchaeaceae archaeon]
MTLWISALIFVFLIVLLLLFHYRSYSQLRVRRKLETAFFLGGLGAGLMALNELLVEMGNSYDFLIGLSRISYSLTYFIIFLFFEGGMNEKPKTIKLVVLSVFLGGSIISSIMFAAYSDGIVDWIRFFGDISRWGLGFLSLGFGTITLWKVSRVTHEKSAILQMLGTGIISIGFLIQMTGTPKITKDEDIMNLILDGSNVIIIIGILSLLIIYTIKPTLVERIPIPVYQILVYTSAGSHLNSVRVSTRGLEKSSEIDDYLITGLATALTSFVKEVTGSERELEIIKTTDRVVMFDLGDEISLSMIAERTTEVLLDSLHALRKKYEEKVDYNWLATDPLPTEEFAGLIHEVFPYLDVQIPTIKELKELEKHQKPQKE